MKLRGSFLKTLESTTVAIEPASRNDQSLLDSQEVSRTNRLLTFSANNLHEKL